MARRLTEKEQREATGFTPIRSKPDSLKEWLKIIWADFKPLIFFGILFLFAIFYTVRACTGAVKPDITVMFVSSQNIWDSKIADRLSERLTPYAFDVNGDGVVKVSVSVSCYFTAGSTDEGASAYQEKFFTELVTGQSFVLVCDENVANYLARDSAYEPLTYFSKDLSEDLVGIRLQDTDILADDAPFLEMLKGYRVVMRSFSKEGYDTNKLTKDEVRSAKIFMENVITSTYTKPVE